MNSATPHPSPPFRVPARFEPSADRTSTDSRLSPRGHTKGSVLRRSLCGPLRSRCYNNYAFMVECCFTSTETVGLLGTGAQDGHLHFHTLVEVVVVAEVLLYVHRNRRLFRDGDPGRPPRLSHTSGSCCCC